MHHGQCLKYCLMYASNYFPKQNDLQADHNLTLKTDPLPQKPKRHAFDRCATTLEIKIKNITRAVIKQKSI